MVDEPGFAYAQKKAESQTEAGAEEEEQYFKILDKAEAKMKAQLNHQAEVEASEQKEATEKAHSINLNDA